MNVPIITPVAIANIPLELTTLKQWVCSTWYWACESWTKVLTNPKTGYFAKVNDPSTWGSFNQAMRRQQEKGLAGVGIVLQKRDPYCAFDLDHCRDEEWAHDLIRCLDSYTERSPSGEGYRIFIKGKLPNGGRRKDQLEVYDDRRYVTVTGDHVVTSPPTIHDRQDELDAIYAEYFPVVPPKPRPNLPEVDDWQLFRKIVMGAHGEQFMKLWGGDSSDYQSPSEADLAFCALTAQQTNSGEQIDALYRRSKLFRHKCDEMRGDQTYGQITIAKALGG